jgi:hypothetical protein
MNKKGAKYLSVYWFAILILVAGGIVAMVFVFYGKPYDVRNVEAEIMVNKVADCLLVNGKLDSEINNLNILEKCNFNLRDQNEFYFEVESLGIKQGYFNLKENCNSVENVVCVEKQVFYFVEDGFERIIKILSGVRKENV